MDGTQRYPRWRQVVLDTADARGLAEFYRGLLGFTYRDGASPPASGNLTRAVRTGSFCAIRAARPVSPSSRSRSFRRRRGRRKAWRSSTTSTWT